MSKVEGLTPHSSQSDTHSRCFCLNRDENSAAAVVLMFFLSWKTTVSNIVFNFLSGGANKVETCQALDKSNWRNTMPGAEFYHKGVFVRWRCVCLCVLACLFVCSTHPHFSFSFFVLMMKEKGMFVLHIPDSQSLPPQRTD